MPAPTTAVDLPGRSVAPAHHRAAISSGEIRRTGGVRFPQVDSLRAIAALSVFVFHVGGKAFPGPTIGAYTGRLNLGVTIFFVISGFLLYRPFVAARLQSGRSALGTGRYAWHRFLRIVPAYVVALTATAILLDIPGVFGQDAIVYYGFGQVYSLRTELGGLSQAWTLSIEVAFYVFLPVWAWAVARIPAADDRQRMFTELSALGALGACSFVYKLLFLGGVGGMSPQLQFALASALPRHLDVFAVGMTLAVASVWFEDHPLPRPAAFIDAHSWIPWVIAAVALWVLATQLGLAPSSFARISDRQQITVQYLDTVVALGLVLPAVVGDPRRGIVRKLMLNRALIWVGAVSYGFYLWHVAVLAQLGRWGLPQDVVRWTGVNAMVVWTAVAIGPALGLAAASWYWIEKPALRFKKITPPDWVHRFNGYGQPGWPARVTTVALATIVAWVVIGTALRPISSHTAKGAVLARGGSWVYVAATYDTRTLRLYEDGRLIAWAPGVGRPGPTSAGVEIGNYLTGSQWSGPLKYVAVYLTALSPQLVRLHYYAGTKGWSDYLDLLAGTPALGGVWQNRVAIVAIRRVRHRAPGAFSVEAWLKAYRVGNRVVAALPNAWFLKTDLFGKWNFDVLSGGAQFTAKARLGPPLSPSPSS